MQWHFRRQRAGDPTRDPILGEFFATDAIENPAEALVREGIQNSLDASNGEPVRVRVLLASGDSALPPEKAAAWFDGAWPHFAARGNGLRDAPTAISACPFLVFEDFGTCGLKGDVTQAFDEPGIKNLFFYFFRAEGRSAKGETDRGRWGVGKHVFPRSSAISTVLGLTVREDDSKRLLMGHTILKSHILEGAHYTPDGYLGDNSSDLVLPLEDKSVLDRFASDFRLSRTTEAGLSLVVPFIDSEFSVEYLKTAIIAGYFYPILKGVLSVTVATPNGEETIDADHLVDVALSLDVPELAEILDLVELAEWSTTLPETEFVTLTPCKPEKPEWSPDQIPSELLHTLRGKLERGEKMAIRVPLTVRAKNQAARQAYFNIFLRNDGHESGRPIFIREGIIVSDVRSPRTRGIRTIVVVDDKPIATLLGDSENPAHTQWQKDSSNFKGKYYYGKSYIEFVSKAAYNFVSTLRAQDTEENKNILLDVFSLPIEDSPDTPKRPDVKPKPKPKPGDDSEKEFPSIEPRKKRFRIQRIPGGFAIARGDAGTVPPAILKIRVAYDVRKGNPLKKYDPVDFRVDRAPIEISPEPKGLNIVDARENAIEMQIVDPNFRLTVTGFDVLRDLFVSVRMEDSVDAAET